MQKARSLDTNNFLSLANYHPYLFTLIALTSAAELGLTAFLINVGNELHIWASPNYHSLLILLCFEASWTLLFATAYMMWFVDGGAQILANVASSVFWLLLTSVLWGAAAGLMHNTRSGGNCPGRPSISRCRQSLTVEALGWTEFGLCCVTLLATLLWMRFGKKHVRDSQTFV
ncbi:MARVEL domain-containing protein [Abortiporus biennis]